MALRRLLLPLVVLAACGPTIPIFIEDDAGSADGTGGEDPPPPSTTVGSSMSTSTSTTSATTADDESSSSGEPVDSSAFIVEPDGGPTNIECSMFDQDCPPGQKCMPYANDGGGAWNATKCTPIADDPGQADEPCTVEDSGVSGVDDCDIGLMCWGVDPETLQGECIPMCTGSESDPQCEDPDDWCSITGDGILTLCFGTCDPLAPDCDADEVCVPNHSGSFVCAFNASEAGEGNHGDPCEYINVCNPGLVCVQGEFVPDCEGVGCCTTFCDVTQPDCPDPTEEECLAWFEEGQAPPDLEHVGICGIPQE